MSQLDTISIYTRFEQSREFRAGTTAVPRPKNQRGRRKAGERRVIAPKNGFERALDTFALFGVGTGQRVSSPVPNFQQVFLRLMADGDRDLRNEVLEWFWRHEKRLKPVRFCAWRV